jgi:hypothetical protein
MGLHFRGGANEIIKVAMGAQAICVAILQVRTSLVVWNVSAIGCARCGAGWVRQVI